MIGDWVRTANVVLYFLMVGQSAAVLGFYLAVVRHGRQAGRKHIGLLPLHVLVVTVLFLALGAEALITNLQHLTRPARLWTYVNLAIFAVGNYGLLLVLRYERRRFYRHN